MMLQQPIQHTIRRYMSLKTHRITAMPVVILMPHSACNCRCVMCDIWKGNRNLKQLTEKDIVELLVSLKKLQTRQVVMSGGEALLHPGFFNLCALLKQQGLDITLLSTGLGLARNALLVLEHIDTLIVSLDGDSATHDAIRNIPGAFDKLREGVEAIKKLKPGYPVSARTVIHRLNFRVWPQVIQAAKEIGLDQVSFLPADVSSQAFNRQERWSEERVEEVALREDELPELRSIINRLWTTHRQDFETRFIAESPTKVNGIYLHYAALHGLNDFPVKKCNAPWVSAVVEPDGSVRPCFFHDAIGNIREASLHDIVNSPHGMEFRRGLDMETNPVCRQCVCSLNLHPWVNPAT